MRTLVRCWLLALLFAGSVTAQVSGGKPEDAHERLTRRLERRLDLQSRLLTEVRDLLAQSLRAHGDDRTERVRQEMLAAVATLRLALAKEQASGTEVRSELESTKREIEELKARNEIMDAEGDRLRAEAASRLQQQQVLQGQVDALVAVVRQLQAARAKEEKKNRAGGAGK